MQYIKSRDELERTCNDTQAVAGINSRTQTDGILGFCEQAKEAWTKHTPEEEVGRYRSTSLLFRNQMFLLWFEEVVLNILIFCRELVTLFLTFNRQSIAKFLNASLLLYFKCIILLMHAKRNCGAAAFPVVVISFSLLLCDVGCFFVTQSHSIKVSRWSPLVIFSFFKKKSCRSSTVIVLVSSSRAHLLRSLAMLIQVLLV